MSEGMVEHYTVDFVEADDGWWYPKCVCGWEYAGVVPTAEDAADALMDHALFAARAEAEKAREEWAK